VWSAVKVLSVLTLACVALVVPVHAAAPTVVLTPAGHGSRACVDTPLRITFGQSPVVGDSGVIAVHNADGSVADQIDLADPASAEKNIGGALSDTGLPHEFRYQPLIVDGDTVTITLHRELEPGHTYYVTVDPGVFPGFAGVADPRAWRFTTRPALPPRTGHFVVAADGSGDFCTVQGAIDAVPPGNTHLVHIDVRPGTYTEIDYIRPDRSHITITGAGAGRTIIQYANNDKLNGDGALSVTGGPADVCPNRVLPVPDLHNCWRALFGVDADDVTLSDLTLHNTTPFGGTQAEAFRGNGQHITLDRVVLSSFQDTLRLQGTGFVTDSMITGDVDFVWGTGTAFIEDSTLQSAHAGFVTQIRNAANHGDVLLRDRLTRAAGVGDATVYLGRIQTDRFPQSQVVYLNTAMDSHVLPVGWQITPNDCTLAPALADWEYHSTDLAGNPIGTSARLSCSRQLDDATAALWSDPGFVLGGWTPTTVNAYPTGDQRTWAVRWTATPGRPPADPILVCRTDTRIPLCRPVARPGTTADAGTTTVTLPPGRYVFRYLTATSAPVTVVR
jgi:pectin methylesterase-like acyl-CoA thioesterase